MEIDQHTAVLSGNTVVFKGQMKKEEKRKEEKQAKEKQSLSIG